MANRFRVVIPARYGSTRLPGKALLDIAGKPMVQWVYERASASGASEVIIATDDERVIETAARFGATAIMTAVTHASGTDRIAEIARKQGWPGDDVVVNVQGDEPLMPPALIDQVAAALHADATAGLATLAAPIHSLEEFLDPNCVKVVTDGSGRALYFSRAPIPWDRDGAPGGAASQRSYNTARRHIGIYSYRVWALARWASLDSTPLEGIEKLEQLRALENGLAIRVANCAERPGADVNTREDLERVLASLRTPPSPAAS